MATSMSWSIVCSLGYKYRMTHLYSTLSSARSSKIPRPKVISPRAMSLRLRFLKVCQKPGHGVRDSLNRPKRSCATCHAVIENGYWGFVMSFSTLSEHLKCHLDSLAQKAPTVKARMSRNDTRAPENIPFSRPRRRPYYAMIQKISR